MSVKSGELKEQMTYRIRIECGNCYSRNNYEVDRGMPHSDADLICPNCGCVATGQNYSVIVGNNITHYTKIEDKANKQEKK